MKKIIAGILALALLVTAILFNLPSSLPSPSNITTPLQVLAAPVPREGYILEPTQHGLTGVDMASAFVLTSPYDDAGPPVITIDGQPDPDIERTGGSTFLVTPVAPLSANSLYIFRMERPGLIPLTWAFQTTVHFQVISNLPGNQAVNVPVDTGIEITFTSPGHTDIADYFSIEPSVEGRFISRGATTIFMPLSPLAHQQLYTVTLRAGVGLPGTSEILDHDHVFAFETAPDSDATPDWQRRETIRFLNRYVEFPSFAPPTPAFTRSATTQDGALPPVNVHVYRINSREDALQAFRQLTNAPWWAHFAWQNSLVDTRGLTRVMSFDVPDTQSGSWFETMELPETLPHGFYLINASVSNYTDQMLVQITDLAVQTVADSGRALLWINDMTTGQPAAGAQVTDRVGGNVYTAGPEGIAFIDRQLGQDEDITITAADGKEISLFIMGLHRDWWESGSWWGGTATSEDYWTVLQLDRTLFQRSDTLYFWGFLQHRDGRQGSDNIRNITATLTQGWGWRMHSRDILHRQTVAVVNGAYSGEIQLPHLDPGSYNLTIQYGETVLGSMFFRVEDFVKPPYEMLVSADRRAVFAGEEISFTARAQFFEGTPVSELSVNYNFWGWALRDIPSGRGTTDIDGEFTISATPQISGNDVQGRVNLEFTAEATLPEVGRTHRWANVDVFVNDIEVNASASRDEENATLSVDVHNITLDRINDGTSTGWGDFLCEPVAGQVLQVEVYRVYWVQVRDGEFYCFIERRVVPRYRHNRREEVLERFQLTTDEDGTATREFTVPNRRYESYHARVTTTDGNGRRIEHRLFIGRDFSSFMWRADDNTLFLYSPREWNETYDIGDEVVLTVKRGTEAVAHGSFLFVAMQGGILHYQVGAQNPFTFTFGDEHVPNATVYAFYFNGHTYHSGWQMNQRLRFGSESRGLQIHVTTDQDAYRPGDMSNISISVTDMDGNPRGANLNISVVDEALFALQNYNINTLNALYRNVSDGLSFSLATHRTFVSDGIVDDFAFGGMANAMSADMAPASDESAPSEAPMPQTGGMDDAQAYGAASGTHIREVFRDTAIFAARRTNAAGTADFSFRLPDNITSWRVTISAITDDLYAGNTVENIIVTNPMFLHYTLGSTFLTGDVPTIGVNAYGTSLTGDETINFEVWDESTPDIIHRASGAAFERVNIPLWEMTEEGSHALIIRAAVENNQNLSDAVRHEYRVISTHRQIDSAVFYEVTMDTEFGIGLQGLTNITFTDRGRGQFFNDLLRMRHFWGIRLEGLVAGREADRLIAENFPDADLWCAGTRGFNPRDYQRADGGLSILPHADSDLATTVRLMPFLLDDINVNALRNYLYNIFESDSADNKMLALYGLALLREPVLLDLQNYALLPDLPVRDVAYIALGFAALGETVIAEAMYEERILPHLQRTEPWYRVHTNLGRDSILEATATVALLAAKLNMPQQLGLHHYTARHRTCELTITMERLQFITHEIGNHTATPASITYTMFGETFTRDISHGRSFTLRIPTQNMGAFALTDVTGEVGAVSIHRVALDEVEIVDNDITISRRFLREGGGEVTDTFMQDELIRVEISIDYSNKAIHGSYLVTDFLPAGLAFVSGSARFRSPRTGDDHWVHVTTDGQRVMFFDFNGRFDGVRVYYFYARVISPGDFIAEGALVQNLGARAYLTVGGDSRIVVGD